jgi:hypothetical protein
VGHHLRVGVAGDFAPPADLAELGHERRISTAELSATVGYELTTRFTPRLDLRGGVAMDTFLQHGTVIGTIPVPTLGVDVSMGVAASSRLRVRPWLGARYDLRVVELNTPDVRWDLPQLALAGGVTLEVLLGEIE